jgi:hypothetical protein
VTGRAAAAFGLALGLAGASSPAPACAQEPTAAAAPSWMSDADGRTFRVGFDLGSRFVLGLGYAPGYDGAEPAFAQLALDTGVLERELRDVSGGSMTWKLYHQALMSRVRFGSPDGDRLSTTLYAGRFVSYLRDGRIVVPWSPSDYAPFPLNIGFAASLGSFELAEASAGYGLEIGVVQAAVVLDFWRRRELGSYAELGLGPSYALRLWNTGAERELAIDHVVSPFTTASFTVHHEWDQGRELVDARIEGGYALSSSWGSAAGARAAARYEAVLLGIDDLPLSVFADVSYRYEQAPHPTGGAHQLDAAAGLRLGVPLSE